MRDMFYRLGFSYAKPTYSLAKDDSKKQEKFKEDFELLKKLSDEKIRHILFQDKNLIHDYQAITNTWFLKVKQCIIPTFCQHQGVKLPGVLNYKAGNIYVQEEEHYDAQVFLQSLKNILEICLKS